MSRYYFLYARDSLVFISPVAVSMSAVGPITLLSAGLRLEGKESLKGFRIFDSVLLKEYTGESEPAPDDPLILSLLIPLLEQLREKVSERKYTDVLLLDSDRANSNPYGFPEITTERRFGIDGISLEHLGKFFLSRNLGSMAYLFFSQAAWENRYTGLCERAFQEKRRLRKNAMEWFKVNERGSSSDYGEFWKEEENRYHALVLTAIFGASYVENSLFKKQIPTDDFFAQWEQNNFLSGLIKSDMPEISSENLNLCFQM